MSGRVVFRPGNGGARKAIAEGGARGARLAAEHLLGVSSQLAPIEEGVLSSTATTSAETTTGRTTAAVSFDTPYAVRQHEDLGYRHDPGRQAKYLEQPMTTEADTMGKLVAQAIRAELGT